MDALSNSCSSSSSSFSAVCPKSPPGVLDLYGKRRQLVKVQILEREIGLLQEELKSVEDLEPASRSCKELNDFIIGAKSDPLVSMNEETHKSHLCWKRFCAPWICGFSGCQPHLKMAKCCACCPLSNSQLNLCSCTEKPACQHCCKCTGLSCPRLSHCCFSSSLCNCPKMNLCCSCSNNCCKSCCL
ncbi:guanine nucleotide-binding protein subunit gamma 3-like isoform X2 [Ricinus communis]|uniref:guanine nucleotide-binding protein subunit gamma 3-like isoform X2 n=1 Tax=Ricinus communis TaxID=3988 RepID=UPI0007728C10|nr:guanine nucleotide-binding protein subunit gamma 3-like isoform X2 [Ricinus communis]|eukprot:XP_015583997.1 guanine nucleotide-binding protein subunit gamma 3-like isoform X2 [Ricinus communis]